MVDDFKCGLILLAAGASRRMGRPKQLLLVEGRPLVRRAVETCLAAPVSSVVVVLGAHNAEVIPALAGLPVHIFTHTGWSEGMGSSLAAGVAAALELDPELQGLMIVLADQPELTASHLTQLVDAWHRTGRSIVASAMAEVIGPPVLFAAEWFPLLLTLKGDTGARTLLQANRTAIASVPFKGSADLDTPEDYTRFINQPG